MVSNNAIDSLRQAVQRVGNNELKSELLNMLGHVQCYLEVVHESLHAQRSEIESLKSGLGTEAPITSHRTTYVYDPPV